MDKLCGKPNRISSMMINSEKIYYIEKTTKISRKRHAESGPAMS